MRFAAALLGVMLSAALFGLSFPPVGIRPLAFVCLVPLLLVLRRGGIGAALFLAWLWGVLAAYAIAPEFSSSIADYYARPLWVGWACTIAISTVTGSAYYMAFTPVHRGLARRSHPVVPLLVAAAWVGIELGRGRLLSDSQLLVGNPWGLLGYTQSGPGAMAQIASVTGVYGLSFAVVAINAALAEFVVAWRDPLRSLRSGVLGLALAALPTVAIYSYGTVVLHAAPPASTGEGFVRIAVIQANVSNGRQWRSDFYGENLDLYLDLTRQAFREGRPEIVFWPESSLTFFLEAEPDYLRAIGRALAEEDAELLAGGPSGNGRGEDPHYNSVFALSNAGELRGRYDKQILLPFSEYFPLASLGVMRRSVEGVTVFAHGPPRPPLETRAGRAGILVCNEAMLPELAAQRVREGASYLVSPSNDSWLAGHGFAEQMFQIVSLRAVEQHRYLVRASTSGPSAVIDPWGRVLVRSAAFERQILLGGVRPEETLTWYTQIGDLFGLLCLASAAGGLAWTRKRSSSSLAI